MQEADKNNNELIDIDEIIDIFLKEMDIEDPNTMEAIRTVNYSLSLSHKF